MADRLDLSAWRHAKAADIVKDLRPLVAVEPREPITNTIKQAVVAGSLDSRIFYIWLGLTRDPDALAATLRDIEAPLRTRKAAFWTFYKALRSADSFRPVWKALGGAEGICDLLASLSVQDVKAICTLLGRTGSAQAVREERQQALTKLMICLTGQKNPDKRPLRSFYQTIVPAASEELGIEWEKAGVKWTSAQQYILMKAHPQRFEAKFLDDIVSFEQNPPYNFFYTAQAMFSNSWLFTRAILQRLTEASDKIRIPGDFMDAFVLPRLKRAQSPRYDDEFRLLLITEVVNCIARQRSLASRLYFRKGDLLDMLLQAWEKQVDQRLVYENLMGKLLSLMGEDALKNSTGDVLTMVHISLRYQLLTIIYRYGNHYRLEIGDNSPEGVKKIRKALSKEKWRATFFTETLEPEDGMVVFQTLMLAFPDASFLLPFSYHTSVLHQKRGPSDGGGDPEVLRSRLILLSKNWKETHGVEWFKEVKVHVQQRRKKAVESREWQDRAFWAASALRLCIAAGLQDLYSDTLLWSRRFVKDALTIKQLYSDELVNTKEGRTLLAGFPGHGPNGFTSTKDDVLWANGILRQMLDTAAMVVSEPGYKSRDWSAVTELIDSVVSDRLRGVQALEERFNLTKFQTFDAIWKPTIDTLLDLEKLLVTSGHNALQRERGRTSAARLGAQLVHAQPALLQVELTSYIIDGMAQKLDPSVIKVHTGSVVEMVKAIARGSQPVLACPFIRRLVVDGGDNSSWHRSLFSAGFLKRLPAQASRAFLYDLADTIRDRLTEQNARWVRRKRADKLAEADGNAKIQEETGPYVKVTTVKLLAAILKDVRFIDAESSCEILMGLLSRACHVDIHIAVLESLLATMVDPATDKTLRVKIMDALETHTVPVAAQLSERNAVSDEIWDAAAASDDIPLPEVSEGTLIFDTLIGKSGHASFSEEEKGRLAGLIMQILNQSAANNARWMALFLKRHNFRLNTTTTLSRAPVKSKMLITVLEDWTPFMPRSIFDMIRGIVLAHVSPSDDIVLITKAIQDDKKMAKSNEGRHWLTQFGLQEGNALNLALLAAKVLHRPAAVTKSKIDDGITPHMLQSFMLEVADVLIASNNGPLLDTLARNICAGRLQTSSPWNRDTYLSWKANSVPVLHEIVSRIEASRSSKNGGVRPNAFRIRVYALQSAHPQSSAQERQRETEVYTTEMSELIDLLAARRTPYHEDWAHMKYIVCHDPLGGHYISFALRLGSLQAMELPEPSLADYLRLELAGDLLLAASKPSSPDVAIAGRGLIEAWKTCEAEGVRAVGWHVASQLKARGSGARWYARRDAV